MYFSFTTGSFPCLLKNYKAVRSAQNAQKNIPHLLHQRLFANSIFRVNYSCGSSLRKEVLFPFSSFPSFFLLTIRYWVWRPCLVPPTPRGSPASVSKSPQSCHGVISSSESSKTDSVDPPKMSNFSKKGKEEHVHVIPSLSDGGN